MSAINILFDARLFLLVCKDQEINAQWRQNAEKLFFISCSIVRSDKYSFLQVFFRVIVIIKLHYRYCVPYTVNAISHGWIMHNRKVKSKKIVEKTINAIRIRLYRNCVQCTLPIIFYINGLSIRLIVVFFVRRMHEVMLSNRN